MTDDFMEPDLPSSPYGVIWHAPGTRTFYAGVDRGMLYPAYQAGVPWVGLVGVDEEPTGGDIRPFYLDGIRRRNDQTLEEFAANITAFQSPREFAQCVGELELAPGMYLGQQRRVEFGFSYRASLGSDTSYVGDEYELNLIYNAIAETSSRSLKTLSDSSDVETMSWKIQTLPENFRGGRPSARMRLDSRVIDRSKLHEIQSILYGIDGIEPRLPTINEVAEILLRIDEEEHEDIPWIEPEEPVEGE